MHCLLRVLAGAGLLRFCFPVVLSQLLQPHNHTLLLPWVHRDSSRSPSDFAFAARSRASQRRQRLGPTTSQPPQLRPPAMHLGNSAPCAATSRREWMDLPQTCLLACGYLTALLCALHLGGSVLSCPVHLTCACARFISMSVSSNRSPARSSDGCCALQVHLQPVRVTLLLSQVQCDT
jgi:hypothetical protein